MILVFIHILSIGWKSAPSFDYPLHLPPRGQLLDLNLLCDHKVIIMRQCASVPLSFLNHLLMSMMIRSICFSGMHMCDCTSSMWYHLCVLVGHSAWGFLLFVNIVVCKYEGVNQRESEWVGCGKGREKRNKKIRVRWGSVLPPVSDQNIQLVIMLRWPLSIDPLLFRRKGTFLYS